MNRVECLVRTVSDLVEKTVQTIPACAQGQVDARQLKPGKMLRTRLAACLNESLDDRALRTCAAVEMIHTASLFHDDVIDGATVRRGIPALHQASGASVAVLLGDILYSKSTTLLLETNDLALMKSFAGHVAEVCQAEMEQELLLRGQNLDQETCIRIARGKTGPLFALTAAAGVRPEKDPDLYEALLFAGYAIGTAYQLADDVIDIVGSEATVGKSLGTDKNRQKCTLPSLLPDASQSTQAIVRGMLLEASQRLDPWPDPMAGFTAFVYKELRPRFEKDLGWGLCA